MPCSSAFISTASSLTARKSALQQRQCTQRVMAFEREWPDKQFIKEVEEAFPDQGIANVEEGRVSSVVCAPVNFRGICDVACMCRKHITFTSIVLYTCCE